MNEFKILKIYCAFLWKFSLKCRHLQFTSKEKVNRKRRKIFLMVNAQFSKHKSAFSILWFIVDFNAYVDISSSLSFFLLQCMFLINYYELFECRIIITKSLLLFSVWLFFMSNDFRARAPIYSSSPSCCFSRPLSLSFSSHIIDWNVTLLLCKDTRRMSALEPRPQQMRERERELIMCLCPSPFILQSLNSFASKGVKILIFR